MKLAENSKFFNFIQITGQRIAPWLLISLSTLSNRYLFGHQFFLDNPVAILVALAPTLLAITLYTYFWNTSYIDHLYKKTPKYNHKKKNIHQKLLQLEKYLYLTVLFLSDIIACFEICNFLMLSAVCTPYLPLKTTIFLLSLLYATYIHINCREPYYQNLYGKLNQLVQQPNFSINQKNAWASAVIYALIYFVFLIPSYPPLTLSVLAISILLSVVDYKILWSLPYAVYLNHIGYKQLINFTRLLIEQMTLFNLYTPSTMLRKSISLTFTVISTAYSMAFLNSSLRQASLKDQYHHTCPKA